MEKIDQLYRLVAGGDYECVLELLTLSQDRAADIRLTDLPNEEQRRGAVLILAILIDKLRSARKTLEQRPGGLNTEGE